MSGRSPIYSAFGRDIYASDVVQQAMGCVTDEIKKLAPAHVITRGADIEPAGAGDNRQRVLNNPNHYMTTFDFLGRVMYAYFSKYNAWVVPTYRMDGQGRKTYTGLYPLDPSAVTFMEDRTGRLFVELRFNNDPEPWVLPYSDIIHLRRNYGADEYMGGGPGGIGDERGLLNTLEINHQLMQGISKTMKSSQAINGIVKYGSIIGETQTRQAAKEWEEKLRNNQGGILVMDMQSQYTHVPRDLKLVDAPTLKFIDEKILRHFGVSLPILTGDYTKAQYEAFYQKAVEPLVIQLSQEFTRVLCTESDGRGHKIQFFTKELAFMSIDQKISMVNLLAPTGALFENEKRTAFGMWPLPELVGKRYMSLNWIDANKANEYQVGKPDDGQPANDQHAGGAGNEE
jgi:HK97 family phage portal protein